MLEILGWEDPLGSIPGLGRSAGEGIGYPLQYFWASLMAGKESTCDMGYLGSVPGLERSPKEWKGYPLQYSGLENSMDCVVHGCREPAQEIPPMTRSCRTRETPWAIQPMTRSCRRVLISKASGLDGPPRPAQTSTPKPESVCLTILCLSPALLTLAGGCPPTAFLW